MSRQVYVAVIDSGCRFATHEKVSISIDRAHHCYITPQEKVVHEHGNEIARIIQDEDILIYDIQVFHEHLRTTPLHIYHALAYLLEKRVDVINLSLGLREDYQEIKEICDALIDKGVLIVCSHPRRSALPTYPAAYDKVIKVTSEGMCCDDRVVALNPEKLLFGANPFSSKKKVAGSSVAVAKFTKEYCSYLQQGFSKEEVLNMFSQRRGDGFNG